MLAAALATGLTISWLSGGAKADSPALSIRGPEMLVASGADKTCGANNLSDGPMRALRLASGEIIATGGWYTNLLARGVSLLSLTKDCTPSYVSGQDDNPASFDDRTWIISPWTDDGQRVEALAHEEFKANLRPGGCNATLKSDCYYVSILPMRSDDDGHSFQRRSAVPVAAPREPQSPDAGGSRGFQLFTNVIHLHGHRWFIASAWPDGTQKSGNCLFRSVKGGDPSSWQYLTAEGWVASSHSPYAGAPAPAACQAIPGLKGLVWSLVRRRSNGQFIALSSTQSAQSGQKGNIDLTTSTSNDLVTWSAPVPFATYVAQWSPGCLVPYKYNYFSLLDPKSHSPGFETVGTSAMLFMTRFKTNSCSLSNQRDLVAVPLRVQ